MILLWACNLGWKSAGWMPGSGLFLILPEGKKVDLDSIAAVFASGIYQFVPHFGCLA
jgi:hypothetical protein